MAPLPSKHELMRWLKACEVGHFYKLGFFDIEMYVLSTLLRMRIYPDPIIWLDPDPIFFLFFRKCSSTSLYENHKTLLFKNKWFLQVFFIFLKLIYSLKYLVRKGTGSTVYYSKEFNNKNILRLFFSIQYVDLASLAL